MLLNILFIYNAGENSAFEEIVRLQKSKDAIYGTALNQNNFSYKLEMVKMVKPIVIALGSSTVMQFREEAFNCSFVNCGGAMNHLNEGRMFLEKLLLFHKPKLILLAVDFWWFNENYKQPNSFDYHENDGKTMTFEKLSSPLIYLWEGKITFKDYVSILLNRGKTNDITDYVNIGLSAIKESQGFRKDGSYLYAGTILGFKKSNIDRKFESTLDRIKNGNLRMEYGNALAKNRIDEFEKILNICSENKIDIIIIIPPLSDTVYTKIYSMLDKYSYIEKFHNFLKMRLQNIEFYDFQNILDLGSNDCECIDGLHAGDVTYQKILLKINTDNPTSSLNSLLAIDLIKNSVVRYSGKALTMFKDNKFKSKEVDFLEIGCKK